MAALRRHHADDANVSEPAEEAQATLDKMNRLKVQIQQKMNQKVTLQIQVK